MDEENIRFLRCMKPLVQTSKLIKHSISSGQVLNTCIGCFICASQSLAHSQLSTDIQHIHACVGYNLTLLLLYSILHQPDLLSFCLEGPTSLAEYLLLLGSLRAERRAVPAKSNFITICDKCNLLVQSLNQQVALTCLIDGVFYWQRLK